MQITQFLKKAAERYPNRPATVDLQTNRQFNWQNFKKRVRKLAGALQSLGFMKDDRVAILTRNSDVHLEYYFATTWAGGIFVPLNTRLTSHEISCLLSDCTAKILVADDHTYSKLDEPSKPEHTIFTGKNYTPDGWLDHESFLKSGKPATDINRGGEDVAAILYTGGTTGQPKGAMLTHNNIISNSRSALSILDDGKPWRYLHAAPMYHIADC
jgi:long-chain acyl-CoA synthetase